MAYSEIIADRIRIAFAGRNTDFTEKKMMGGLCFMVDEKMCCGVHIDKKSEASLLMIRVGEKVAEELLESGDPDVEPMDFTGRPMKGYLFVGETGFNTGKSPGRFIQLCLDFNPLAKASRNKSPKKKSS